MNIILIQAFENGARPPIQIWDRPVPPENYAVIPDDFDTSIFYEYNGFVFLTIETVTEDEIIMNVVTAMEPNVEALEAWKATLPEPEPEPEPVEEVDYNELAAAIKEGVDEV